MQKSMQRMKLAPVALLAVAIGACADQSPTEVQSLLETAEGPSLALAGSKVASLAVYPQNFTLDVGQVKQVIALPKDASGRTVSAGGQIQWSSSNPRVAKVDATGRVTALDGGKAYIRAAFGGASDRMLITVREPIRVGSIALSAPSSKVEVGGYLQLRAIPKDPTGAPVNVPLTWASSNPGVIRVFQNGLVQAMRVGTATISVSGGGKTARVNLAATTAAAAPAPSPSQPAPGSSVASVVVYPLSSTLAVGQAKQLIALPRSASGTTVSGLTPTWRSSNTAVATVSSTGLLIAKAPGTVQVTATFDGTTGTAAVTVTR